jgi:hypothetical protein
MAENKFAEALKQAAEKMREKQAEQAKQASQDSLVLAKPDSQEMVDGALKWIWRTDVGRITAMYFQKNMNDRTAGEYVIELLFEVASDYFVYTPEQSKMLAVALYSAYVWENIWQQHAGEFLAVKPKMPKAFEDGPWKSKIVNGDGSDVE